MEENSPLIINNDNDLLHDWYLKNKDTKNIFTYGMKNESDIMAKDIQLSENGSKFKVKLHDKIYDASINALGIHFVMNSLCAICVGLKSNISIEKILQGIREFELTKSRMEIIERKDGIKIINDSYNASYDSMKAALEYLKVTKANKKVAILGDILETGEFARDIHENVGEEVYKNSIDVLITVGDNARYIAEKAIRLGMTKEKVIICDTNEEAVEKVNSIIQKGDYILVKASWGMKFREIVQKLID